MLKWVKKYFYRLFRIGRSLQSARHAFHVDSDKTYKKNITSQLKWFNSVGAKVCTIQCKQFFITSDWNL